MRSGLAAGMAALTMLLAPVAAPQEQSVGDPELETILIAGEQPGPGLWKISKGDRVLWVLPSLDPLGSRMVWRTTEVEARIAESQEVLYPPEVQVEPSVGVLQAVKLLAAIPAALKAVKNPRGARLGEVLGPETHAKWRVLRDKFYVNLGKKSDVEDIEKWRPAVAMSMLQGRAQARSGLANRRVDGFVMRTAATHMVPVNRPPAIRRAVKLEKNIRGMAKEAAEALPAELECFQHKLETLEPAIERDKERANAWARGDIARLRELPRDDNQWNDCMGVTLLAFTAGDSKNAARARKMVESVRWHEEQARAQAQRDWVAAAMLALDKNPSTFAVLRMEDVFRSDGHVEALRQLGYTVEEPQ